MTDLSPDSKAALRDIVSQLEAKGASKDEIQTVVDHYTGRSSGPTLSAGEPESFLSKATGAIKQAVFGDPDREEARRAGIGLSPTTADMIKTGLAGASAMAGGAAIGGLATAPAVAARGLAYGTLGSVVGKKVGHEVGGVAETVGAPAGTQKALEAGGAVVGGFAGMSGGPKATADIIRLVPHSRVAMIARYLAGSEPAAAASTDPLIVAAQNLAKTKTFPDASSALTWLKSLHPEQQAAVMEQSGAPAAARMALPANAPPRLVAEMAQKASQAAPEAAGGASALETQLQASIAANAAKAASKYPPEAVKIAQQILKQPAKELAKLPKSDLEHLWEVANNGAEIPGAFQESTAAAHALAAAGKIKSPGGAGGAMTLRGYGRSE